MMPIIVMLYDREGKKLGIAANLAMFDSNHDNQVTWGGDFCYCHYYNRS